MTDRRCRTMTYINPAGAVTVSGADRLAPPGIAAHALIGRALRGPDLEEELWNMLATACDVLRRFGCLPDRVLPSLGARLAV